MQRVAPVVPAQLASSSSNKSIKNMNKIQKTIKQVSKLTIKHLVSVMVVLSLSFVSVVSAQEATTTATTTPSTTTATTTTQTTSTTTATSTPSTASTTTPASTTPPPTEQPVVNTPPPTEPITTTVVPSPSTLPQDTQAPSSISDLSTQFISGASVDLIWTTPSDNIGVTGYEVRISPQPINTGNWNQAIQVSGGSTDKKAGEREVFTISGLPSEKTIYIGVRASDAAGNTSSLSTITITTKKSTTRSSSFTDNGQSNNPSPLTPRNAGTARMVLRAPDGGVPEDLIFVNFINKSNGLSFGTVSNQGVVTATLPEGKYETKFLLPPHMSPPSIPPVFEIKEGEDVDVGIFRLNHNAITSELTASVNKGGIGGTLSFIVQLLFEILKELKSISGRI
jgi:hypothetical protein